jgi:hypothetical protein
VLIYLVRNYELKVFYPGAFGQDLEGFRDDALSPRALYEAVSPEQKAIAGGYRHAKPN